MSGKPIDSIMDKYLVEEKITRIEAIKKINEYIEIKHQQGKFTNEDIECMKKRQNSRSSLGEMFADIVESIKKEDYSTNIVKEYFKAIGIDLGVERFGTDGVGLVFTKGRPENKPDYLISFNKSPYFVVDWKICAAIDKNTFKKSDLKNYLKYKSGIIVCMGTSRIGKGKISVIQFLKECKDLINNIKKKNVVGNSVINKFVVYGHSAVKFLNEFEGKNYFKCMGVPSVRVSDSNTDYSTFKELLDKKLIDVVDISNFKPNFTGPLKTILNKYQL